MINVNKVLFDLKNKKLINKNDAKTLLKHFGFKHKRTKGTHESWVKDGKILVLAFHDKTIKKYQANEILKRIEEINK